jgi:hypothetical protein
MSIRFSINVTELLKKLETGIFPINIEVPQPLPNPYTDPRDFPLWPGMLPVKYVPTLDPSKFTNIPGWPAYPIITC